MKMKRKDILGYFGFPACETMVKTFAKIKPELCSVDLLVLLRTALQNYPSILRQLSFWEVLNSISLYIYCKETKFLNHNLIANISTREAKKRSYVG